MLHHQLGLRIRLSMFFLLTQPQKQGTFFMHRVEVQQRGTWGIGVITDPYGWQNTRTCQAVTRACAPSDLIRPHQTSGVRDRRGEWKRETETVREQRESELKENIRYSFAHCTLEKLSPSPCRDKTHKDTNTRWAKITSLRVSAAHRLHRDVSN